MPSGGLDASWKIAADHAAKAGLVFGRDFVFTYGPFAALSTDLFDASSYGWVLAFDVAIILL